MLDLTPREAGATEVALRISKKILALEGVAPVRIAMEHHQNLRTFCGFIARLIDKELTFTDLAKEFPHSFRLTPSEQGKLDGQDAKLRPGTDIEKVGCPLRQIDKINREQLKINLSDKFSGGE